MKSLAIRVSDHPVLLSQKLHDRMTASMGTVLLNTALEYRRCPGYSEIVLEFFGGGKGSGKGAKNLEEWPEAVGQVLADFIVDEWEEELLRRLIRKDKRYSEEEREEILAYCRQLGNVSDFAPAALTESSPGHVRKRKLLMQDLADCLHPGTILDLDGFFRFRLKRYGAELKEMLEYASDEFLMDQQYKEFISLLRYFVYVQDSKMPLAHIIHQGGHNFLLLDSELRPIDTEKLDTSYKVEFMDKDYNLEDMIVSSLLTIAPERICIHTREPDLPVIKTLSQIFENRTEICQLCRSCESISTSLEQQDKLSP
ncbi:putative sporulation protein YtxC [Paenibacillus sp. YN15]|uniref:putative sporulation protein YtxC n=1 Tax=Paenibacillus sp. YN15 TaxID=1742774 RepID=UPI000DCC0157|nr:putative sporulation protein YtxC [Paenibacillus sp. YN15]RAU91361.1 putative sporulation protein YtxC [Paenibacillus sp. YN15]